jgi:hypothetical protein
MRVCPVESFGSGIPFGTGGILMTTGVMVRIASHTSLPQVS